MKTLTLGWRLGLAFGALILLMGVLGGIAVWRMNLAVRGSSDVSAKFVPEVHVAQEVVVCTWETRFNIRNYTLTGDEDSLLKGRRGIADLKEQLKVANDLAKTFPDLVILRQGAVDAGVALDVWNALIDRIETERNNLKAQQGPFEAAGVAYMEDCHALQAAQERELKTELDEIATPVKLKERLTRLGRIQELIDRGMAIRLGNFKAQAMDDMEALRDTLKDFVPLDETLAGLAPLLPQPEHIAQLRQIRESASRYKTAMEQVLKSQLAINDLREKILATSVVLGVKGEEVAHAGLQSTEMAATAGATGLAVTVVIVLVGLVVALILGVLVAWLSTRAITGPIRESVNALASTATEMSATISQLASNASEAAAAVAETTATVEEVRQTAQVAADKAKAVADNAQGAARAAEAGRQAADQTVEGLTRIRDQMGSIGESITRLNERSQAVGDIVSTVTDLAEQSNLLAVNASIEAAKAGDMGKGFAVVAQEIRTLAEQSKDSTKQVRAILTEVQKATGKAVLAAEQGGKTVADGGKQADEAGQAIRTLTSTIQEATRAAVQIAASSQQQLLGMEQVGRAMDNIKQATTQNAEGARQLSAAAHNLQQVGLRLKALVDADG